MNQDIASLLRSLDDIERILHKRAERRGTPEEDASYAESRRRLLTNSDVRKRLPELVHKSSNLQATWGFLKDFSTWRERREFVSSELERARAWLEGREETTDPPLPDSRTFLHTLRSLLETEGRGQIGALTLDALAEFAVRDGNEGILYLRVPVERIPRFGVSEKRLLIEASRRVLPSGLSWTLMHINVDPFLEAPPDENEPLPPPIWKPERAIEHDGLWFRSKTEIRIYEALKKCSVFFFVNATGVLGGKKSISGRPELREPDFAVCLDGKWGILEVMGESVHTQRTAPRDHDRARLFKEYGVTMIEFFDAHRCYTDPEGVVREFLQLLSKSHRS